MDEYRVPVLLTELKVRKHKRFLSFDKLGGFYQDHLHAYSTKPLGRYGSGKEKIRDLEQAVRSNPLLNEYPCYVFKNPSEDGKGRITPFELLWLKAPPEFDGFVVKEANVKRGSEEHQKLCLPKEFVRGGYTDYARWTLCGPWHTGELDLVIASLLQNRNRVDAKWRSLERAMDDAMKGKSRSARSRMKALVYAQPERVLGSLGKGFEGPIAEARAFLDELSEKAMSQGASVEYARPGEREGLNDEIFSLHLPRGEFFIPGAPLQPSEIRRAKWLVLDTESPFFMEKDQTVTWIPYAVLEDGKITERKVMTTNSPGMESMEGYRVVSFDGSAPLRERAERMVEAFADEVRRLNPLVVSAYNAAYDLPTLRDMGGFRVGNRDTRPRFEVTLNFFKRVGISGRLVYDPMRVAKMGLSHLVNMKADNVLSFLLDTPPFKELDHEDLGELEHLALGDDVTSLRDNVRRRLGEVSEGRWDSIGPEDRRHLAAQVIGSYAVLDVEWLAKSILHPFIFNTSIDIAHQAMLASGSDYGRLLHLPGAINDGQEKSYHEHVGVRRQTIYLPTKQMKTLERQARTKLRDVVFDGVGSDGEKGLHENVWLCRLPLGEWLYPIVARNYPPAKDFFERTRSFDDPHGRQMANDYLESMCKYLVADLGQSLRAMDALQRNAIAPIADIIHAYWNINATLTMESRRRLRRGKLKSAELGYLLSDRQKTDWELQCSDKEITQATLDTRLRRWSDVMKFKESYPHFLGFEHDIRLYAAELNKKAKVGGNYNIDPDFALAVATSKGKFVGEYLSSSGLRLVHRHGSLVFVKGSESAVKSGPWIPLEKIPLAYVSDDFSGPGDLRIFYRQRGFYKGLKVPHKPMWTLCTAEAALYSKVLDLVLDGENDAALQEARSGLETFIKRLAFNKDPDSYAFESARGIGWIYGTDPTGEGPKAFYSTLSPKELGFRELDGRKVMFKRLGRNDVQVELKKDDRTGIEYYDEPYLIGRHDSKEGRTHHEKRTRRVVIGRLRSFDVQAYASRARERLLAMLEPICPDAKQYLALQENSGSLDIYEPLIPLPEVDRRRMKQGTLF